MLLLILLLPIATPIMTVLTKYHGLLTFPSFKETIFSHIRCTYLWAKSYIVFTDIFRIIINFTSYINIYINIFELFTLWHFCNQRNGQYPTKTCTLVLWASCRKYSNLCTMASTCHLWLINYLKTTISLFIVVIYIYHQLLSQNSEERT